MARKGIQLCYPFEEKRLLKWQPPFIVQPKFDGIRCRAIKHGRSYILLSSEENIIFLPHIVEALNKLEVDHEFDGELYVHGWPLEQINGVSSRTVNPHEDAHKMQFHIFDIINEVDIQATRLVTLQRLMLNPPLIKCPYRIATDLPEILEIFREFIDLGYEGIIVRHHLSPYVRKRSTYMMKYKPKKSDIYPITGYKEEVSINGVPKNTLGSLELWDGTNHFYVGAGLNTEDKITLWAKRDELIGKYAKIWYQCITSTRKVPKFVTDVKLVETGEE